MGPNPRRAWSELRARCIAPSSKIFRVLGRTWDAFRELGMDGKIPRPGRVK